MGRISRKWLIVGIVLLLTPIAYYLASPLFINVRVDEPLPTGTVPKEGQLGSPSVLKGVFMDADSFHKSSGSAFVVKNDDGSLTLRFENFAVTNGPDLYVYLAVDQDVGKGFVNLGRLKGNQGNQNYEIPAGTDLSKYRVAMIWCRAFSVLFGYAPMA